MKKNISIIISLTVFTILMTFLSCEPISLKTTIDEMILGWSREVTLVSPEDGAGIAEKTPLLDWEDAGGATGYQIQISDSDSFDGISPITIKGAVSKYEIPDELIICDTRYWRVKAVQDGEEGDKWSETRRFDIVISPTPELVGTLNNGGSGFEFVIDGDYAYLANGTAGVQIINISDPANPTLTSTLCDTENVSKPIYKWNQYIYFEKGGDPQQIVIYDVSDPAAPVFQGACDTIYNTENYEVKSIVIWAEDSGVLLVENKGTVEVNKPKYGVLRLNLSDLANPTLGSIVEISGGEPWVIKTDGTTAAITVNNTGVLIYNILDNTIIGQYDIPTMTYGNIDFKDGYVFVTSKEDPLHIISIQDPTNPTQAGTYPPAEDKTSAISIFGHYAFLVKETNNYEMHILDISNVTSPEPVTITPKFFWAPNGNYGYAQNIFDGEFYVIDLLPED